MISDQDEKILIILSEMDEWTSTLDRLEGEISKKEFGTGTYTGRIEHIKKELFDLISDLGIDLGDDYE